MLYKSHLNPSISGKRWTSTPESCSDSLGRGELPQVALLVRDYLAAVLPGFADLPIQRLDLTPTAAVLAPPRNPLR